MKIDLEDTALEVHVAGAPPEEPIRVHTTLIEKTEGMRKRPAAP